MDLVEKARREQVATAGVVHGGATASFLRGEDARGEKLIESLTREEKEVVGIRPAAAAEAPKPPGDEVLAQLLAEESNQAAGPADQAAAAPKSPQDVESSVIDDLLGGDDTAQGEEPPGNEKS